MKVDNTLTGDEFDVTMPDDQKVEDLIPILVEKMEAGDTPVGKQLGLRNRTQYFEYAPDDTLHGAGTKANSSLNRLAGLRQLT